MLISSWLWSAHSHSTVTFTITKFEVAELLPYVPKLLKLLVELRTIQVTLCRVPGEFKKAIGDLSLPSVRTLVLPTGANALVLAARNVLHVRCAGGPGSALIAAMKGTKCERLDGMINWCTDPKLVGRESLHLRLHITLHLTCALCARSGQIRALSLEPRDSPSREPRAVADDRASGVGGHDSGAIGA